MTSDFDRTTVVETICERLAQGETLSGICGADGLPSTRTWLRWCDDDEKIAGEYSRALAARAEWYAAEHDRIRKAATDRDTAAGARVQLQALEWQMQRAAPKRYGERVDVSVSQERSLSAELEKARLRAAGELPDDRSSEITEIRLLEYDPDEDLHLLP